jgi:hypothetical protein
LRNSINEDYVERKDRENIYHQPGFVIIFEYFFEIRVQVLVLIFKSSKKIDKDIKNEKCINGVHEIIVTGTFKS